MKHRKTLVVVALGTVGFGAWLLIPTAASAHWIDTGCDGATAWMAGHDYPQGGTYSIDGGTPVQFAGAFGVTAPGDVAHTIVVTAPDWPTLTDTTPVCVEATTTTIEETTTSTSTTSTTTVVSNPSTTTVETSTTAPTTLPPSTVSVPPSDASTIPVPAPSAAAPQPSGALPATR
jgi:hypothetical protein